MVGETPTVCLSLVTTRTGINKMNCVVFHVQYESILGHMFVACIYNNQFVFTSQMEVNFRIDLIVKKRR